MNEDSFLTTNEEKIRILYLRDKKAKIFKDTYEQWIKRKISENFETKLGDLFVDVLIGNEEALEPEERQNVYHWRCTSCPNECHLTEKNKTDTKETKVPNVCLFSWRGASWEIAKQKGGAIEEGKEITTRTSDGRTE